MHTQASRTAEIISQAESYDGIRAGIASLENVLAGPSYQAGSKASPTARSSDDIRSSNWPADAQSVLVLAMHHPEGDPRLDDWERGDTWGNRRLREISKELQHWLRWAYHMSTWPLPYHVGKGGLFLKDAAALAGIGIIGQNNLTVHPQWGPRIRLRAILLGGAFQSNGVLAGFSPCQNCPSLCQTACPMVAFPQGKYNREICKEQMNHNMKNRISRGELRENGKRDLVISYCRACETSCPVGA